MSTTEETQVGVLRVFTTTYEVGLFAPDDEAGLHFNLKVEYRGDDKWAVLRGTDGLWDWESNPSSRTDEWLATHHFDLDAALDLARQHAPQVKVNGRTAAEAAARRAKPEPAADDGPCCTGCGPDCPCGSPHGDQS
jgi:hypothetical protein